MASQIFHTYFYLIVAQLNSVLMLMINEKLIQMLH